MEGKVYISSKDMARKEWMKKRVQRYFPRGFQIIYTDKIRDADYILIERKEGKFSDIQFQDLMIARERGAKVWYMEDDRKIEKADQIEQTRKNFDMEIE